MGPPEREVFLEHKIAGQSDQSDVGKYCPLGKRPQELSEQDDWWVKKADAFVLEPFMKRREPPGGDIERTDASTQQKSGEDVCLGRSETEMG
jgi:hypothetical protein